MLRLCKACVAGVAHPYAGGDNIWCRVPKTGFLAAAGPARPLPARERYACVRVTHHAKLFTPVRVGLEWREGENFTTLLRQLRFVVVHRLGAVLEPVGDDPAVIERALEEALDCFFAGRAFYIEVGDDDNWCQVFQPWGMPRLLSPDPPPRYDDDVFEAGVEALDR